MKKIIEWFKNSKGNILLLVILVVLVNLVFSRVFVRFDLTGPKSYTLSESSKEIVRTIDQPLSIKVFFTKDLPSPYSDTYTYLKDLLSEYENASNSNFKVEWYDMSKEANKKIASNYNVNEVRIQQIEKEEASLKNAYMSLVVSYGDQSEVLYLNDTNETSGLEYKLTTSLSKVISSTDMLAGLKGKVRITLYKTEKLGDFNIANFNQIDSVVDKVYANVSKKYGSKVELVKVNPDSEQSEKLKDDYGIVALSWKEKDGSTSTGALGLTVSNGDNVYPVPLGIQNAIFQYVVSGLDSLEDNINLSIQNLLSKTSVIGYITGHGENDINDQRSGSGNFSALISDIYKFKEIKIGEEDIPLDVKCIVINGPKSEFTDAELYKIDQFVLKGGNLIVFDDSYQQVQQQSSAPYQRQQPQYIAIENGLSKLLNSYGLKIEKGWVMDELCFKRNDQNYGEVKFYMVPQLGKENLDQNNVITKNLSFVLFANASSIDVSEAEKNKDAKVTVLAKTSGRSWIESQNISMNPLYYAPPSDKSLMSSKNLSVLVEGKFKSAFEKNPVEEENASGLSSNSHIASSVQKGKVILVSSSAPTTPLLLSNASEPIVIFLRNTVDYMNGNEDFCTMRTKNLSLNALRDDISDTSKTVYKWMGQLGLAVLVAIIGLLVLLARSNHRNHIREMFNPDDPRFEQKKSDE
ncbi:Gldg family protein [Treponema sp.]|uniref:Gldg family protein n=1 Tax=Treponema sp. TaxID=166 RepID=UPI0025D9B414|nr:Gldg family protein [Treponema sp.]MCR5218973.1 Gldg family protein [Treponema sp.]